MQTVTSNPLSKHFRQPKLYIRLPSGGNFYRPGSFVPEPSGEYPVYAMTAKDELIFKTPDALLNGQSTVNVIQSCMPNIKNAWDVPSIDIDAILIAIRIATYGEKMELGVNVEELEEERTFELDLRVVLDGLIGNEYKNVFQIGDFTFEIHPMNYRKFTDIALKTFEEQRIFRIVNDDKMSETDKIAEFNQAFLRITDLNISNIVNSVVSITYLDEEPVTNVNHIAEFFENADKDVYASLITHIDEQRERFTIKPFKAKLSEADIERGAPETLSIPITFDQANFFA